MINSLALQREINDLSIRSKTKQTEVIPGFVNQIKMHIFSKNKTCVEKGFL